ncbi:Rho/RAC guanine nucleotide exchange factor [Entamoeba marina]
MSGVLTLGLLCFTSLITFFQAPPIFNSVEKEIIEPESLFEMDRHLFEQIEKEIHETCKNTRHLKTIEEANKQKNNPTGYFTRNRLGNYTEEEGEKLIRIVFSSLLTSVIVTGLVTMTYRVKNHFICFLMDNRIAVEKLKSIGLNDTEIIEIKDLTGCKKLLAYIHTLELSKQTSAPLPPLPTSKDLPPLPQIKELPPLPQNLSDNSRVKLSKSERKIKDKGERELKKKKFLFSFSSATLDRKKINTIHESNTFSQAGDIEMDPKNDPRSRRRTVSAIGVNRMQDVVKSTITIHQNEIGSIRSIQSACRTFVCKFGYNLDIIIGRKEAIKELYETEVSFCEKMNLLNTHFRIPFMQLRRNGVIFQKSFDNVFLTLEDLIICSQLFIEKLRPVVENFSYNTEIGPLMEDMLANVWPYIRFSIDHNIAQAELKFLKTYALVSKVLREKSVEKALNNETIDGLLIQPVQRIMRYPVLLKQILRLTPKTHNDYKSLFEANADYTFFIHEVNERAKLRDKLVDASEKLGDMDLIQPWRYCLKEAKLKVNGKQGKIVYLMNDMICWESSKLLIDNKTIITLTKETTCSAKRLKETLTLKFESEREMKDWKSAIDDLVTNNKWKTDNEKNWFSTLCKFKSTWLKKGVTE